MSRRDSWARHSGRTSPGSPAWGWRMRSLRCGRCGWWSRHSRDTCGRGRRRRSPPGRCARAKERWWLTRPVAGRRAPSRGRRGCRARIQPCCALTPPAPHTCRWPPRRRRKPGYATGSHWWPASARPATPPTRALWSTGRVSTSSRASPMARWSGRSPPRFPAGTGSTPGRSPRWESGPTSRWPTTVSRSAPGPTGCCGIASPYPDWSVMSTRQPTSCGSVADRPCGDSSRATSPTSPSSGGRSAKPSCIGCWTAATMRTGPGCGWTTTCRLARSPTWRPTRGRGSMGSTRTRRPGPAPAATVRRLPPAVISTCSP